MVSVLVNSLAIIVLLGLVFLRGRDTHNYGTPPARWLRLAGFGLLGLQVAIYLLFGIGEMAGGDFSGAGHLLSAGVALGLAVLVWVRPLEGGLILFLAGLATAITLPELAPLLILAAPYVIGGGLLFASAVLPERPKTGSI